MLVLSGTGMELGRSVIGSRETQVRLRNEVTTGFV